MAKYPNASKLNIAFTKHITNALIEAREERLKLEASIPRKLQDGWEPTIRIRVMIWIPMLYVILVLVLLLCQKVYMICLN